MHWERLFMLKERQIPQHEFDKIAEFIPGPEPRIEDLKIPVSEPDLRGNERKYVLEAIDSTWISSRGKFLDEFEQAFAEKVGAKYGVAVNSGTNALYLAAAALGIKRYDEVIMPTFTMIATPNSVAYLGAIPQLIDSDEYWQMDVEQIEKAITKYTKAITPVHIYGHPVRIDKIQEIAEKHGLIVIYDAAEAQGAEFNGIPLGGIGDAVCYSFYGNKILTTGEGGMITTNNAELAEGARNLKDIAFSKERHFWHTRLGYNFRMTNLAAAVGRAQTERFEELVETHRRNASLYKKMLEGIPGITTAPEASWAKNVYWMFGILIDQERFGMTRDQLREFLAKQGVETRTFFVPIHFQPYYFLRYAGQRFPIAERLCRDGMYLPSSSLLTEEMINYVCTTIEEAHETTI